jgi:CHAD domain-containing protein
MPPARARRSRIGGPFRIVSSKRPVDPPALTPDDRAAAVAGRVLATHLATLEREEAAARSGQVEGVHQLRVATRRLRSAVAAFAPVWSARDVHGVADDLKSLGRAIGEVRDLDVLKLALTRHGRRLPPDLRRALRPLHREIARRRAAALGRLVTHLDGARFGLLRTKLGALSRAEPAPSPSLTALVPNLVGAPWQAAVRAGARLDGAAGDAAYHRLRVRVKGLRYTLESLRELGAKRVDRVLERLADLQNILGAHQDAVTQMAWLRRETSLATHPDTLLAMGALVQVLARRAAKNRLRARREWKAFERKESRRKILAELARPEAAGSGPAAVVPAVC